MPELNHVSIFRTPSLGRAQALVYRELVMQIWGPELGPRIHIKSVAVIQLWLLSGSLLNKVEGEHWHLGLLRPPKEFICLGMHDYLLNPPHSLTLSYTHYATHICVYMHIHIHMCIPIHTHTHISIYLPLHCNRKKLSQKD